MSVRILTGDCRDVLRTLPDESVHCCVTSPPYFGLRDYGVDGQIGLERTVDEFVAVMVDVFREVRRVLRDDGTLWLNLGDSYATGTNAASGASQRADVGGWTTRSGDAAGARRVRGEGYKVKDLMGMPWRVAFALQADGWYLRQDIVWAKPNPMPESVRDRCTKAHEYLFLLSKSERYHFDADAIAEPLAASSIRVPGKTNGAMKAVSRANTFARATATTPPPGQPAQHRADREAIDTTARGVRNKRSVWTIATQPFKEAHFATFPPALVEPCILAGCPEGGTVLDPFGGAGTTGLVADRLQRNAVLIELNPQYAEMARRRINADSPLFGAAA